MPFSVLRRFRKFRPSEPSKQPTVQSCVEDVNGDFVMRMDGVTIGHVAGSVMSHNHITVNHYHSHDQDEDTEVLRAADIIYDREQHTIFLERETIEDIDGPRAVVQGEVREYTGHVVMHPSAKMLIWKYEGTLVARLRQDFDVFSALRHPNIIQLYARSSSVRFPTLVFHGTARIAADSHHQWLRGFDFITYPFEVAAQFLSADRLVAQHNLRSAANQWHFVDSSGKLTLHEFYPANIAGFPNDTWSDVPKDYPYCFDDVIRDLKRSLVVRSRLSKYYQVLALACSPIPYTCHQSKTHSPTSRFGIEMEHPRLHLPFYALPLGTFTVMLKLDQWHPGWGELNAEFLPDMTLRCKIPPRAPISRRIQIIIQIQGADPTDNSFESLFKVWASQAHHLLNGYDIQDASEMTVSILATFEIEIGNKLPKPPAGTDFHDDFLYLFCRPPDSDSINYKCSTYWTLDLEGQHRLTDSEMEERFGTTSIAAKMVCSSYIIPSHIYPILHKIHTACGFNPHSTEMAEYLGLPVLEPVADLDVSGVADTRD